MKTHLFFLSKITKITKITAAITLCAFSQLTFACMAMHMAKPTAEAKVTTDHNHNHNHTPTSTSTYSPALFENINHKMHEGMNIQYANQVDIDFLKGMIPHHEGAVEMAKVVLMHSKDEKVKKLAQDIIDAQNKEIEMMKNWVKEKN